MALAEQNAALAAKEYREDRAERLRLLRERQRAENSGIAGAEMAGIPEPPVQNKSAGARVGATAGDVGAQLLIGASKGLEGIADFLIGIGGGVAGIFSKDAADAVKDVIAYDAVGNWYGNALIDATGASFLRDNKGGQIAEEVISGVGQMLPAVIAAIATAGASSAASGSSLAASMGSSAAQAASLGTLMASAAGTSTEEAYQDGAGYYQGLAYGTASGLVEGATEKMFGGFGGLYGKGAVKSVGKNVAKTGARRVLKEAAGEAVEEMTSELVNPVLRTIYKGRDALDAYGTSDYWAGVGEAGLVGGLTSVAYGGTVGKVMKTTGVYADASEVLNEIDGLERKLRVKDADGRLGAKERGAIVDAIAENYKVLSDVVQKTSEKKRAEILNRHGLSTIMNERGELDAGFLDRMNTRQEAAHGEKENTAYSAALVGKEVSIEEDLAQITESYRKESGNSTAEFRLYEGELNERESETWKKTKQAVNAMNRRSGLDIGVALVDADSRFHGVYLDESGTIYINKNDLTTGKWAGDVVHEAMHESEGTPQHGRLTEMLVEDEALVESARVQVEGTYVDAEEIRSILEKRSRGSALTEREQKILEVYLSEMSAHMVENLLGNERFIRRLVRADRGFVGKILNKLEGFGALFGNLGNAEAKKAAAEVRAAEKLYLKALDNAGLAYVNRKIVEAEDGQAVDESAAVQYNRRSGEYKQISRKEYAIISERIMADNSGYMARNESLPKYGVARSADYFYVYENFLPGDFGVLKQIKITDNNREFIVSVEKRVGENNGESIIGSTSELNRVLEVLKSQAGRNRGNIANDSERRADSNYRGISATKSESNGSGDYQKSNGDRGEVKFSRKGNYYNQFRTLTMQWANNPGTEQGARKMLYDPTTETYRLVVADASADGGYRIGRTVKDTPANVQLISKLRKEASNANNRAEQRTRKEIYADIVGITGGSDNGGSNLHYDQGGQSNGASTELAQKSSGSHGAGDIQQSGGDHRGVKFSRESKKVSDGVWLRLQANRNGEKVYTRQDADRIVRQVLAESIHLEEDLQARLTGKNRAETTELLWKALNALPAGERGGVALKIADYIIQGTMVADVAEIPGEEYHRETLNILREYLHKFDLSSLSEEIKSAYGKGASTVRLLWGKKNGGITPDMVRDELAARGFTIDADNPTDILFRMDEAYRASRDALKKEADTALRETLTESEYQTMRQEIAKQILRGYDTEGEASVLAKVRNEYAEQLRAMKASLHESAEIHHEVNTVLDKVQKIKEWKTGEYTAAAEYKSDGFLRFIGSLTKIRYRGNLRQTGTREIVGNLQEWYNKENPLYADTGRYNDEVAAMIHEISAGEGDLSLSELKMLSHVIDYFGHEAKTFRCVYRNGKYEEAEPIARAYKAGIEAQARTTRAGIAKKFLSGAYGRQFSDPPALVRAADGYQRGWFGDFFRALRRGAIDSSVREMDLSKDFNSILENKKYRKRFFGATVSFDGISISLRDAMSLYMTLQRAQAQAGLAENGIKIKTAEDDTLRLIGFAKGKKLSQEELLARCREKAAFLASQFTETDKKMIAAMEKAMKECREIKRSTDLLKNGFSNVEDGAYYWPIKRANTAQTVDKPLMEVDRVSNLSFNKSTVKGARGELLIEPCDTVFRRHVKGISLYGALGVETENINRLMNLNVGAMPGKPETILTAIDVSGDKFLAEMQKYLIELKADVEGDRRGRTQRFYNDAVNFIRSGYAKFQLGLNPKVLLTQLSSLFASTNILDVSNIVKGFSVSGKDVDQYCRLAELRNNENTVAKAEGVLDKVGKVGDAMMTGIGKMDRWVVCRLFAACQVQVQKQNGLAIGTVENKTAAGKLLENVILETQQNSLLTERSAAMRSGDELLRGATMFTADSMKIFGRMADAWGEFSAIKSLLKNATGEDATRLRNELKRAKRQVARSTSALVATAVFNALVALFFKHIYNKDTDWKDVLTDTFGNLIGGLPFIKDIAAFFTDGYEMDNFFIGTLNDLLGTVKTSFDLVSDAVSGRTVTKQEAASCIRKVCYAAGQCFGIPVRNVYNFSTGMVRRFCEPAAYAIDGTFYKKAYSSDLKKALEAEDEKLVRVISSLMVRDVDGPSDSVRETMRGLLVNGYSVLPRSIGDTVTVDGEEIKLTKRQKKRFREVYDVADEAVETLCKLERFAKADDAAKAKAIRFIYDVYYNLALDDLTGEDSENKNVLFAEAIDIEKLALILAEARSIEGDKDRQGNTVAGSKKRKVQLYINALRLSAAQKYMVMGYLGYRNLNGENQVRLYVNRLNLSKAEKKRLLEYSGYATQAA